VLSVLINNIANAAQQWGQEQSFFLVKDSVVYFKFTVALDRHLTPTASRLRRLAVASRLKEGTSIFLPAIHVCWQT
jgi:hypothetical protein